MPTPVGLTCLALGSVLYTFLPGGHRDGPKAPTGLNWALIPSLAQPQWLTYLRLCVLLLCQVTGRGDSWGHFGGSKTKIKS